MTLLGSHLAYASADLMRTASLSATNEDPAYPIERVQIDDVDSPCFPFRATTNATTITIDLPEDDEPEGLMIAAHNLEGAIVTLRNDAGFEELIAIPLRTPSGLCVNAFFDMRGFADRVAAAWELEITAAAGIVSIGRIVLVGAEGLKAVPFLVGSPKQRPERLVSSLTTFFGHDMIYDKGIRMRSASGRLIEESDRAIAEAAWEAAAGTVLPFLYLPDVEVNDAWWVRFTALEWSHDTPEAAPTDMSVREISMGLHSYGVGSP